MIVILLDDLLQKGYRSLGSGINHEHLSIRRHSHQQPSTLAAVLSSNIVTLLHFLFTWHDKGYELREAIGESGSLMS